MASKSTQAPPIASKWCGGGAATPPGAAPPPGTAAFDLGQTFTFRAWDAKVIQKSHLAVPVGST